jgi:hypothetical protein
VTGRLQGTLFGRPVELEATGRQLMLRIVNLRSAWRLRRSATSSMLPLLRALRSYGLALQVRIGSRLTVQVLPTPSFGLRLLVPTLSLTSSGDKA